MTCLPKPCPIRIGASALGQSLAAEDLIVSPQHRILVRLKIGRNRGDIRGKTATGGGGR
ncbi:Hint domain-containing protein (plasmid) [Paracoccus seriniphilus]|nr:Hint domain-containing protein [Paracoccus seriniphilus]